MVLNMDQRFSVEANGRFAEDLVRLSQTKHLMNDAYQCSSVGSGDQQQIYGVRHGSLLTKEARAEARASRL
jgi:hypothetical protein